MGEMDTKSDSAEVESADAGSPVGVIEFRSSLTLDPTTILLGYSGGATNEATIALYDEPHDTDAVSESNVIVKYPMSPGDVVNVTGADLRSAYSGVIVVASNIDDTAYATVGGEVTSG